MNIHSTIFITLMCLGLATLLLTLAEDSASAQPVSKTEKSASVQIGKTKTEQGPKIIVPKEQEDEADKALAFLKVFEQAVLTKDYQQVAPLISSNFVKVKPGQPLGRKDIKFIESLFCGWVQSWKQRCIKLKNLKTISLQELNFYMVDAWQLRYSITGHTSIGSGIDTLIIDLSLTKETVEGQGKVLRLMGPAG